MDVAGIWRPYAHKPKGQDLSMLAGFCVVRTRDSPEPYGE